MAIHLKPLKRKRAISAWSDRDIDAGAEWEQEIDDNLEGADIILLLVSPGFLASDYITSFELIRAMEKHNAGEARVIPIVIKPVEWADEPVAKLQLLPRGGKPVSEWTQRDKAWKSVIKAIKSVHAETQVSRHALSSKTAAKNGILQFSQVIPLPVTHPVGRKKEIRHVVKALKEYVSVAITGIAGVGKTTVLVFAVREMTKLEPSLYSHICYHRIVEQGSEEQRLDHLIRHLINCFGIRIVVKTEDISVRINEVRKFLANHRVLLALDNADEHKSRAVVEKVSREFPNLIIAVTSRHSVWSQFEKTVVGGLSDEEGIRLFETTFERTVDKKQLTTLCRKVKGHPMMITHLALEARELGIPPGELLSRYRTRAFNIGRDLEMRINTFFERFPDKFDKVLDIIGLMATDTLEIKLLSDVLAISREDLGLMADQGIIFIHPNRKHFTVHELIRTWCRNRLENRREQVDNLIPGLMAFYLDFFKTFRKGGALELSDFDYEWPNVLALMDRVLMFENAIDPVWVFKLANEAIGDHYDDPNGYIPRSQKMYDLLDDPPSGTRAEAFLDRCEQVDSLLSASIEKNLGHFYYWRGKFEQAEYLFHRARDRYRNKACIEGEAVTTWLLGYLAEDRSYYAKGQDLYEQGASLAQNVQPANVELRAIGHHLIGCNLYHQGRFTEAVTEFLRAKELNGRVKSPHLSTRIERRLACVALRLKRLDEAEAILRRVDSNLSKLKRPRDSARIARQFGLLYLERNELEKAEKKLQAALKGFKELGASRGIGYTTHGLAILRRKQKRLQEARELCEQSLQIARNEKSLYGEAAAYEELYNIMEAKGASPQEANRQLRCAYNIYSVIGNMRAREVSMTLEKNNARNTPLPGNMKGIVFDLMDTLAYLKPGIYKETQQECAQCLGVSFDRFKWAWDNSRRDAQSGIFKTTEDRMHWVANELKIDISDELNIEMAKKIAAMWKNEVKLFKETVSLLKNLKKRGFRLAVASNGPVAMKCLKESLNIQQYLDVFHLSCEVGIPKPGKEIYLRTLEALGVKAEQCVFIGDGNDNELDGAGEVGMFAIKINRIRPGYANVKNESLHWDLEVDDLDELKKLLYSDT